MWVWIRARGFAWTFANPHCGTQQLSVCLCVLLLALGWSTKAHTRTHTRTIRSSGWMTHQRQHKKRARKSDLTFIIICVHVCVCVSSSNRPFTFAIHSRAHLSRQTSRTSHLQARERGFSRLCAKPLTDLNLSRCLHILCSCRRLSVPTLLRDVLPLCIWNTVIDRSDVCPKWNWFNMKSALFT